MGMGPYLGLTSASVLEDTPEDLPGPSNGRIGQAQDLSASDLEDSSKKLEAEAAQQRE